MKNKDYLNVLIPEIGEVVTLENSSSPNMVKRFFFYLSVKLVKHSVICIVEKQISLIKFATLKYERWFNPDCFWTFRDNYDKLKIKKVYATY